LLYFRSYQPLSFSFCGSYFPVIQNLINVLKMKFFVLLATTTAKKVASVSRYLLNLYSDSISVKPTNLEPLIYLKL